MRRLIMAILVLGAGAVALALDVHGRFSGVSDVAHESVRLHLKLTVSGIYEYRTKTGTWPTQHGDLARTSLPAISPYWRYQLDEGLIVIVWHKDLKPDPMDN